VNREASFFWLPSVRFASFLYRERDRSNWVPSHDGDEVLHMGGGFVPSITNARRTTLHRLWTAVPRTGAATVVFRLTDPMVLLLAEKTRRRLRLDGTGASRVTCGPPPHPPPPGGGWGGGPRTSAKRRPRPPAGRLLPPDATVPVDLGGRGWVRSGRHNEHGRPQPSSPRRSQRRFCDHGISSSFTNSSRAGATPRRPGFLSPG